jgi:hypothetical protein
MLVIPWLDQGIQKAWMPGSSPGMTAIGSRGFINDYFSKISHGSAL